jgi:hypothetical protein
MKIETVKTKDCYHLLLKIKILYIFFQNKKEFFLFCRILLLREGKLCQNISE